ncbi:MAG: hypothetical protein IKB87_03695 [Clostridia bacterium]|nr:hypothetical protein [Clostridia bacterium]
MTASQYKNILQWTLFLNPELEKSDAMSAVRKLFDNLGVAFPQGTFTEILSVLKNDTFLGWRSCSCDETQKYADIGIPAIGVANDKTIIIPPKEAISILTANKEIEKLKSTYIKYAAELTAEERENMCFFVYSYGYKPKDSK